VAAATLIAGTAFARHLLAPPGDAGFAADARKVNALADQIFTRSRAAGLKDPRVAIDHVTDALDAQVLRVICYERHHVWIPFVMTLPTGIFEEKPALLLERLRQSDFVFLTEDGPIGAWPYDREMRGLLPDTKSWCQA